MIRKTGVVTKVTNITKNLRKKGRKLEDEIKKTLKGEIKK